jgi:hypothetical protein
LTVTSLFCNGAIFLYMDGLLNPFRPDRQVAAHLKHRCDQLFAKLYSNESIDQLALQRQSDHASHRCDCSAEQKQRGAILTNPQRIKLQSDLREAF